MPSEREILLLLRRVRDRLDGDMSLDTLAAQGGWSRFHFHRAFRAVTGETPRQYTSRLRLERAATRLLTGTEPIVAIATRVGFASHEVFTRAFRRHFTCTPAEYRARGRCELPPAARLTHLEVTANAGPCIGLFHLPTDRPRRHQMPMLSIERREITAQPILFVRLKSARHELPQTIAQGVGKVYMHAQQAGVALAGHPFTRYPEVGPGLMTVEVGFRVSADASGRDEIEAGLLPGGPAVVAMHGGPYDQLGETYAAAERWMEGNRLRPAGAPWEHYVTDPAEHPDPAEWRTEVFWPVAERT
jgi:AraC family transcriptional regulator